MPYIPLGARFSLQVKPKPDQVNMFDFCHHFSLLCEPLPMIDYLVELEQVERKILEKGYTKAKDVLNALKDVQIISPVGGAKPQHISEKRLTTLWDATSPGVALIFGFMPELHVAGSKACEKPPPVGCRWDVHTIPGAWKAALFVRESETPTEEPSLELGDIESLRAKLHSGTVLSALADFSDTST